MTKDTPMESINRSLFSFHLTENNISYILSVEISTALQRNNDGTRKKGDCVDDTPQAETLTETRESDYENGYENQSESDGK